MLSWYARDARTNEVISVAMSTFDDSSQPLSTSPIPSSPGKPSIGSCDSAVAWNKLSPIDSRPGVHEAGQADPADRHANPIARRVRRQRIELRLGLRTDHRDAAIRGDPHLAEVDWQIEARLHGVAGLGEEVVVAVEHEHAVARVADRVGVDADSEVAGADHREVELAIGRPDRALGEIARHAGDIDPRRGAELAVRYHLAVQHRQDFRGVEHVLEVHLRGLVTGRIHVREVVRDQLEVALLGDDAAPRRVQ